MFKAVLKIVVKKWQFLLPFLVVRSSKYWEINLLYEINLFYEINLSYEIMLMTKQASRDIINEDSNERMKTPNGSQLVPITKLSK